MPTMTVSGNEITDALRAVGTQGDGLSNDSSYGIWEATTNLVTNGGCETNTTGWNAVSSTPTRVTSQFKFGAASLQIVTSNAAANEGAYHNFTATAAVYTISAWVRGASGTVRMAVRDNTGANPQTGTAVTLSTTWQRIRLITTNLTAATWRCYIETDVQQNVTFQVDGVQAEQFPPSAGSPGTTSPYVHTDGGTAARGTASVQGPGGVLNSTQGWVSFKVRCGFSANDAMMFSWIQDTSNQLECYYAPTTRWYFRRWTGGAGGVQSIFDPAALTVGTLRTVIFRWDANQVSGSTDGAAFSNTANTSIPTITSPTFGIGYRVGSTTYMGNSDFLWCVCGAGTLSDADAATIHAFGNAGPSTIAQLPGTAVFLWQADTTTYLDRSVASSGHGDSTFGVLGPDADIFNKTGKGEAG